MGRSSNRILRLIEALRAHEPELLNKWLDKNAFVFANVPYRIKSLEAIFDNPKSTIIFDSELSAKLRLEAKENGSDSALLRSTDASIYKANLTEKILIPTCEIEQFRARRWRLDEHRTT